VRRTATLFFPLISILLFLSPLSHAQSWTPILDDSRAIDWSSAGIPGGIPDRTTVCATLSAGASASQINSAISSCPDGQVVMLGAGTYNLSGGVSFNGNSNVTLRGAGPMQTILVFTAGTSCNGASGDICLTSNPAWYSGSSNVNPGGQDACNWTGGYAKGSTTITLSNCGSAPPAGQMLILDQANDTSDTGGAMICDVPGQCRQNTGGNNDGRVINGVTHSLQQIVKIVNVSGSGTYTVTISPGVYANNIRSSQSPGAWWPGQITMSGIEDLTVDGSNNTGSHTGVSFYNCYECWMKNVRSLTGGNRNHVWLTQSARVVIRDSYFYGTQRGAEESYGVEPNETSDDLIENNIFDHVTSPILFGQGTGLVMAYNFTTANVWNNPANFMQASYESHNAGSMMNLWEGNVVNGIFCDNTWGSSDLATYFRNQIIGWQTGKSNQTNAVVDMSGCRGDSYIGNVIGQPGYHTQYELSNTAGSSGQCNNTLFVIGLSGQCSGGSDKLSEATLMRWGNYDTVNGAVRWNASEVPTTDVPYISGNAVPGDHNLPNSFYLSSKPDWWGASVPWPPIGPDVSGGSGPAGHAYAIPSQACFNSGTFASSILNFDASACYTLSSNGNPPPLAPPTGLTVTVQ